MVNNLRKTFISGYMIMCSTFVSSDPVRPNIILILADDAGWNDFSFHGSSQIPTPNIDALAFRGTILNSYYSSPLCTPTRGSILTGKYPIHIGLQHYVIRGDTADGLPLSEKLLPKYLKELGYATHLVGKWHLGHATKLFSPTFRGFDTHYGYWLGSQDYYDHTSTDAGLWGYDFRSGMDVDRQSFGLYNTDLITNESVRLIKQHPSERPMFLMISHTAPHSGNEYNPLQAPQENVEKFRETIQDENRRVYAAMVDKLDESVGIVFSTLAMKGILNNSIIIFASDNGGAPEGVKNTLWEGGTRVAACIWSSQLQNRVTSDLMHASDWLPTLYEAAGGNPPDLGNIDGISLWNTLISGAPSPRLKFLYNIDDTYNNSAVRFGSWKLIQGNTSTHDLGGGIWDGWYGNYSESIPVSDLIPKILQSNVAVALESIGHPLMPGTIQELQRDADIQCTKEEFQMMCNPYAEPCLFNIVEDPCEQQNVAKDYITIVEEGLGLLKQYNDSARGPIDLSHHPEAAPHFWGYVWTNWMDYLDSSH